METTENYRMQRIMRLLSELEYEVTRGMMEREIDETIGKRWFVPVSKQIHGGVVRCEFLTRPLPGYALHAENWPSRRLQIVGTEK